MAASIEDVNSLINTLTSLQPRVGKVAVSSDDDAADPLVAQCNGLLEQTPELYDIRSIKGLIPRILIYICQCELFLRLKHAIVLTSQFDSDFSYI